MDDTPSAPSAATAAPPLSSSDTDELLDLLNNTIRSLANDAAAVRQMTDLADVLEYSSQPNATEAANDDNGQGEGGQRRRTRQQFTTQLYDLDNAISIMEGKVEELKDIINHEKDAIVEFETSLQQEAEEQERLITSLQEHATLKDKSAEAAVTLSSTTRTKTKTAPMAMTAAVATSSSSTKRVPLLQSRMNAMSMTGVSAATTSNSTATSTLARNTPAVSSNRVATPGMKRAGTAAKTGQHYHTKTEKAHQNSDSTEEFEHENDGEGDRDGDGQDQDGGLLKFERITQSELAEHNRHSVPFGTSRISRMDLNETLEEIEVVVHKKVELSKITQKKAFMHDTTQESYVTTNSLQRRFDYLQQRHRRSASKNLISVTHLTSGPGSPVDTTGHGTHHHNDAAAAAAAADTIHTTSSSSSSMYPVSEQELRENCAFFRHGESTARSTLSMLCNLKRIRQIPMKSKDDITYVCLFKGNSKTNNKNTGNGINHYDMQRLQPSSSLPSWSP